MFVNIHSHKPAADLTSDTLEVYNLFHDDPLPVKGLYSTGIHPWSISKITDLDTALDNVEKKLKQQNLIFVGEIGIDRCIETPLERQITIFEKQLALAEKYTKGVIIHSVRAYPEIISCLKNFSLPVIFHGFNANLTILGQLLKKGCYISYCGRTLLKNPKLGKCLKETPLDKLFLETDDTGEDIRSVYHRVSEQLNIDEKKLREAVLDNLLEITLIKKA